MADDASQPLIGVDAKLRRAKEHVDALEAEMSGVYTNTHPLALDLPSEWEFAVIWNVPSIIHASTVAGDAVHNIRSALDYLVWDLVGQAGIEQPGRHTNFPIFDKRKEFLDHALRGGGRNKPALLGLKLRSTALRLIVSEQPYRSPEPRHHPLFLIKQLSNIDKHQTLFPQPHFADPGILQQIVEWNPNAIVRSRNVLRREAPIERGTELMRVTFDPSGPPHEVNVKGSLPVHPRLRGDVGVSYSAIRTLLLWVMNYVDEFRPIFL